MRYLLPSILFLFLSFPSSVLSETVEFDDLVERDGLYYKKFTNVPFAGEVTGQTQGKLRDGMRGGWITYHDNGQLKKQGTYKNGKAEGEWVSYHDNGQLWSKGTYRNGKREGLWVFCRKDGIKDLTGEDSYGSHQGSGLYKNGEKVE